MSMCLGFVECNEPKIPANYKENRLLVLGTIVLQKGDPRAAKSEA
jgi:hypothetical protein